MNVLFLAFANDQQNPLPTLSREDDGLYAILNNRYLKGHFIIHRDSFATLEKMNQYLGKYRDRLALFLYSGHADATSLHLDSAAANAQGIAHQLGQSAGLKLVILNGCSTRGQVGALLAAGVPAVVATSAPVDDKAATAFSLRFFQNLSEKRMSIQEAFADALGPAQTATDRDLQIANIARGATWDAPPGAAAEPLWGLFANDPAALAINPIPAGSSGSRATSFQPNARLTETLFETLQAAECRDIQHLYDKEAAGDYVEIGDKQTAIVNVLPLPVSAHLQKLVSPVESDGEGFDKISTRRLEQIATVFHSTIEFLGSIMLAQLWEMRIVDRFTTVPPALSDSLNDFINLSGTERAAFDYLPLIGAIRAFIQSLHEAQENPYFITELNELRELLRENNTFSQAANYLTHLRRQTVKMAIAETDVADMCEEAESKLCDFFAHLGFLHRYQLTSIQNIDIRKYRHQRQPTFSHETVKLMRAFGKPEQNFYLLSRFLDNRGVALIKGKVKLVNARKREFTGDALDFLNLSPFVIDRNAFEDNTDLSNLLFYEQPEPGGADYRYKSVKRPDSRRDRITVAAEGPFAAVHEQLHAFRAMILNK